MKIKESGIWRNMTTEEIAEWNKQQENIESQTAAFEEKIEAQIVYTAMMTNTLIEEE